MSIKKVVWRRTAFACLGTAGCLLATGCVPIDGESLGSFVRDFLLNAAAALFL